MAMAFLGWVLYASRGAYRFDGTTISAPGHEKVSLKSLRKIDASKWDRKGIAYLQYQMPGSAKLGVIKLDDFIYQRKPTDEIFRQITLAMESNKPAAVNAALQRITCSFCNAQNLPSATNCSGCGAPLDVKDLVGNG
jgi:ribosomal protein L40E